MSEKTQVQKGDNEEFNDLMKRHILLHHRIKELKSDLTKIKSKEKTLLETMGVDTYYDTHGNKFWINSYTQNRLNKKKLKTVITDLLVKYANMSSDVASAHVEESFESAKKEVNINATRLDTAENMEKFKEGSS